MSDSASEIMLRTAVETSKKNDATLNKILGGLIVLSALQTGFIAMGSWVISSTLENTNRISVIQEQVNSLKETMNRTIESRR